MHVDVCCSCAAQSLHDTTGSDWQVDGRVEALASSSFGFYLGGTFGLAMYEDSSRARTLFPTQDGGIRLTGGVHSLAAADGCVYAAGALKVLGPSSSAFSRLVRYCPSLGAGSNSTLEPLTIGDPSDDWKLGLVLYSLHVDDSITGEENPTVEGCAV